MRTKLNRRVGCEFEGYTRSNPRLFPVRHAIKKKDGSLKNLDWTIGYRAGYWGMEVECLPTDDVEQLWQTFDDVACRGWFVDQTAGTHVHVEASDFKMEDKARLLMFTALIQEVAFLFVDEKRFNNVYCRLHNVAWANVFDFDHIDDEAWRTADRYGTMNHFMDAYGHYDNGWMTHHLRRTPVVSTDKYHWVNVHTRFPTVEFRLFHGIESYSQILDFTNIAVGIVDLVKYSTVEQLKFVAHHILDADDLDSMSARFLQAIGVHWHVPIVSELVKGRILGRLQASNPWNSHVYGA